MMKEGNIVVYQDVSGRWISEGLYDNMRTYIPNKKGNVNIKLPDVNHTYKKGHKLQVQVQST